ALPLVLLKALTEAGRLFGAYGAHGEVIAPVPKRGALHLDHSFNHDAPSVQAPRGSISEKPRPPAAAHLTWKIYLRFQDVGNQQDLRLDGGAPGFLAHGNRFERGQAGNIDHRDVITEAVGGIQPRAGRIERDIPDPLTNQDIVLHLI